MQCPQCSAPINDSQSAFCPRCGTRLPHPVVLDITPTPGRVPVPHTLTTTVSSSPVRLEFLNDKGPRVVKVVVSALLCAVVMTWCAWVTNYLQALPTKSQAVYRAMQNPHNMEDLEGFGYDLGRDSFSAALPFGIVIGLAFGTGLGLLLTSPVNKNG